MSIIFATWPEIGLIANVVVAIVTDSTESFAYGVEVPIPTRLVDVASVTCPPSVTAYVQFTSPPPPEPEASGPHCRFPLESVSSTSVPLQPVTPTLVNEDWVTDEPRVVESKTRTSFIEKPEPVGRFIFPPVKEIPPAKVEVDEFVTAKLLMVEVPRKVGMFVAKILPPAIVSPLQEERPAAWIPPANAEDPAPLE